MNSNILSKDRNIDEFESQFAVCEYDEGTRMKCYGYYGRYHQAQDMTSIPLKFEKAWECPICERTIFQPEVS